MPQGRTIGLYGDSGSGKTTQAGEYAKYVRRTRKSNTVLFSSDMGGFDSLGPLVRVGVVHPVKLTQGVDPWIWIDDAVSGKDLPENTGLVIYDSGTSQSEALLSAVSKSEWQIGQRPNQKWNVTKGERKLTVANTTDAQYGVVQTFMLDSIWKSTWLADKGIDVLWTFSVHRGEEQDRTPILGPKLAGKALTAAIPKWFNYFWRIASVPVDGEQPRHVLYTAEVPELAGLGHSFGNSRLPLGTDVALPAVVEPASITTVLDIIDQAQKEAEDRLREELGL